jgi:hypothetical protein
MLMEQEVARENKFRREFRDRFDGLDADSKACILDFFDGTRQDFLV